MYEIPTWMLLSNVYDNNIMLDQNEPCSEIICQLCMDKSSRYKFETPNMQSVSPGYSLNLNYVVWLISNPQHLATWNNFVKWAELLVRVSWLGKTCYVVASFILNQTPWPIPQMLFTHTWHVKGVWAWDYSASWSGYTLFCPVPIDKL